MFKQKARKGATGMPTRKTFRNPPPFPPPALPAAPAFTAEAIAVPPLAARTEDESVVP